MTKTCPRCHQAYEPTRSGGLCPHCGHSGPVSRVAVLLIGIAAIGALAVGAILLRRPLAGSTATPPAPAPASIPDSEFPAARASIRPPAGWKYEQRDDRSIAFKLVPYGAAVRFTFTERIAGREAHLALLRERVAGAEPVDRVLPAWPGAESLAFSIPGNPSVGASWLFPRDKGCLQVLYWGDESHLEDVKAFREGLRLSE
jgi:hypothetical protein